MNVPPYEHPYKAILKDIVAAMEKELPSKPEKMACFDLVIRELTAERARLARR